MPKKNIITAIIVFLAVLVFGAGVFYYLDKTGQVKIIKNKESIKTGENSQNVLEEKKKKELNMEKCLADKKELSERMKVDLNKLCDVLVNGSFQEDAIAVAEDSEKRKIATAEFQKNEELYAAAKKEKTGDKCLEMPKIDATDLCLKNIAIENKDETLCKNIKDEEVKNDCLNWINYEMAKANKDIMACEKLVSGLKNSCIVLLLTSKENCAKLQDKENQNICFNQYYFNEVQKNKDAKLCTNITDEEIKQACESIADSN
ncbi:MAG: hypothetical protein ABH881_03055 [bacterium]